LKTIFWLRKKQEKQELKYWASFVFYNIEDHSFNNQIYLVYLFLFFGLIGFMGLTFISNTFTVLLQTRPVQSVNTYGVFFLILILIIWCIQAIWHALKISPIRFSEEDLYILNQTPLSRRLIVLRWLWMPWIKQVIPFCLLAIITGFAIEEVQFLQPLEISNIQQIIKSGGQFCLLILPIHFSLFLLVWMIGILRLKINPNPRLVRFYFVLIMFVLALVLWRLFQILNLPGIIAIFTNQPFLLKLLIEICFALLLFALLSYLAKFFTLNRAALETQKASLVSTAKRYFDPDFVQQIVIRDKLIRVKNNQTQKFLLKNSFVLLWKNFLTIIRTNNFSSILNIFFFIILCFGLLNVNSANEGLLIFLLWSIQISNFSVPQLRRDLKNWVIFRQFPISAKKIVALSLVFPAGLMILIELTVVGVSSFVGNPSWQLFILSIISIPLIGLMAFTDIFDHCKAENLMDGYVPQMGPMGLFGGILLSGIPLLIFFSFQNWIGFLASLLLSSAELLIIFQYAVFKYKSIR